jgi:3-oxoacyl-(acyl-carrier-protein) synthase
MRPVRRFDTVGLPSRLGGEMPDPAKPWPRGLRGAAHLDECVVAAMQASGLGRGARVAVIVATTKGFLDAGSQVAARHEAHDVGAPARYVADVLCRRFGARVAGPETSFGPMTISTACASGTAALAVATAQAAAYVDGGIDAVVVAGVDLLSDFVYRGFASLGALDAAPCRPFDVSRAGLTPSEGAAAIVLEPEQLASAREASILARFCGWGLSNDCAHPTAPARDGAGMIRAIRGALATSGFGAAELGHVHAHGTATPFNDAMEARALAAVLGDAAGVVPVTTLKGSIGHAFGAAGLLETIASIAAARRGIVPPIAGLRTPEPGAWFVAAPTPIANGVFLKTSAGFGGFNAAVVVEVEGGVRS